MRVLHLTDRAFARREQAMLQRLAFGLLAEGVMSVRASPMDWALADTTGLTPVVTFVQQGWSLLPSGRTRPLRRALEAAAARVSAPSEDAEEFEVIHAWGDKAWPLALSLARQTGAAVLLEAWSARSVAGAWRADRESGALKSAGVPCAWMVPDDAIGDALRARRTPYPIFLAPWGVFPPDAPRAVRAPDALPSIAVVSPGHDVPALEALIEALAELAQRYPEVLMFFDGEAFDARPVLWKRADRLGLLSRTSAVDSIEAQRALVLQADVLVIPDAAGEHRSIVLDAMSAGMALVSRRDPLVRLVSDEVALIVAEPTPRAWFEAIDAALQHGAEVQARIATGQARVRTDRSAHDHVNTVLAAYHAVASSPMKFAGARRE